MISHIFLLYVIPRNISTVWNSQQSNSFINSYRNSTCYSWARTASYYSHPSPGGFFYILQIFHFQKLPFHTSIYKWYSGTLRTTLRCRVDEFTSSYSTNVYPDMRNFFNKFSIELKTNLTFKFPELYKEISLSYHAYFPSVHSIFVPHLDNCPKISNIWLGHQHYHVYAHACFKFINCLNSSGFFLPT